MKRMIIYIVVSAVLLLGINSAIATQDLEVAQQIARSFISELPVIHTIHSVSVLPVRGDKSGLVTEAIREELLSATKYRVIEIGTIQEEDEGKNGEDKDYEYLEVALRHARTKGISALVLAEIKKEQIKGRQRRIIASMQVIKTHNAEIIYSATKEFTYNLNKKQFKERKQQTLLLIGGLCFIGIILVRRLAF